MNEKNGGWTSPTALLNIASILMVIIGGYLATQGRTDDAVRDKLDDHERRLVVVETKQDVLWYEREREHERERRE